MPVLVDVTRLSSLDLAMRFKMSVALTAQQAKTRTYVVLTWQKPVDMAPNVQSAFVYRGVIAKQADGRWLFKERVAVDPPNL